MSSKPIAEFTGENGVKVEVFDRSRTYAYKNIYHVKLDVVARVPGCAEPFTRKLEKMGVFEEQLAETVKGLLESFEKTGLGYLMRPDFAERYAAHCEAKAPNAAGYGT